MKNQDNRRILLIDDNEDIHRDFRKILVADSSAEEAGLRDAEDALFGDEAAEAAPADVPTVEFQLESALQGQEALERVRAATAAGEPFALAFVDMRMPPGWDGVETIRRLWDVAPDLQVVICTAFADYTWSEMVARLGRTDRLLILKKPFDAIEVSQLALAMTEKWNAERRAREELEAVLRAEAEARSYASSLETVNQALELAKTSAEAAATAHADFLTSVAGGVLDPISELIGDAAAIRALDVQEEAWAEVVERLCADGGRLASTLQDVLDLAEIEAGTLDVAAEVCSPAAIAERTCARHRDRAGEQGLELTLSCGADTPERIAGDAERLGRVLDHLVANAVTYTEAGGVQVEVDADPAAPDRARFVVIDTGPGLSAEERAHLFQSFCHQRGSSDPRDGAGLGLSLCKRLTHALGGEFEIQTSAAGTRVTVTIGAAVPAAS